MTRAAAPVPLPVSPGGLRRGLFAGEVLADPVPTAPRRGRVRRWSYVAAGDGQTVVGAAVVHLGAIGVAFAFASVAGRQVTWATKRPVASGVRVGGVPADGAEARTGRVRVDLGGDGSIHLDVPTALGRLMADVRPTGAVTPAILATRTPDDGWNVTQKVAGTPVEGELRLGSGPIVPLGATAGGWSDWTTGRQDRRTTWRWAAGAGGTVDGKRVGINASTGMNGREAGEDVVWWDGVPHGLRVDELTAVADASGPWRVSGPGSELRLEPSGVRSADEHLGVLSSRYVQPFGRWTGALTDPDGISRAVTLAGVAEDHLALW
jgi:hypothetical protein